MGGGGGFLTIVLNNERMYLSISPLMQLNSYVYSLNDSTPLGVTFFPHVHEYLVEPPVTKVLRLRCAPHTIVKRSKGYWSGVNTLTTERIKYLLDVEPPKVGVTMGWYFLYASSLWLNRVLNICS